jgi:MoxR-like ATPase
LGITIILLVIAYLLLSGDSDKDIKAKTIIKSDVNPKYEKIIRQGLQNLQIELEPIKRTKQEIQKKIVGLDEFVNSILVTILSNGHLLVEGVPGLAKTKTIETLSYVLDLDFKRIQFTPDMLPADIIGTQIYNQKTNDFEIKL